MPEESNSIDSNEDFDVCDPKEDVMLIKRLPVHKAGGPGKDESLGHASKSTDAFDLRCVTSLFVLGGCDLPCGANP